MTFDKALKILKQGGMVKREGWVEDILTSYLKLVSSDEGVDKKRIGYHLVYIINPNQTHVNPDYKMSSEDVLAEDWVEVR